MSTEASIEITGLKDRENLFLTDWSMHCRTSSIPLKADAHNRHCDNQKIPNKLPEHLSGGDKSHHSRKPTELATYKETNLLGCRAQVAIEESQ